MSGYEIFVPPLFTSRAIRDTDMAMQQAIDLLEAPLSAPNDTFELEDAEGYLTAMVDASHRQK
ncbi:MAG: hypothetical protein DI630_33595 [Gordonia sp. (in: high G+C Gram-positive bacteria)]|nr:MAG: hypothetical protein DI630_33595 [Gordonia sp. (in: high G+C Gram-positive bacteria)]